MGGRQGEDGEALWQGFSGSFGEFRGLVLMGGDEALQQAFGLLGIGRVEDGADVGGDGLAHLLTRHVGAGVLLQVKPAVLRGHGREHGGPRGLEAGVVVGDEERRAVQAAIL